MRKNKQQEVFQYENSSEQYCAPDFLNDALYSSSRFRTVDFIDDFNRECLVVDIDTSITGKRLIRLFERLRQECGLPEALRVDNGPEFLSGDFVTRAEQAGMSIRYI